MMRLLFSALASLALLAGAASAEFRLLMAEEVGCPWCARWDAEVSEIYPKTPEGQAAPLQRVDIHGVLPGDVTLNGPLVFTPTFVLLEDGAEAGRIEGYPGDMLFWMLLGKLLTQAGAELETSG